MSADGSGALTERQPGHPNLLGPRWEKGNSGNPTGKSNYQRRLDRAIRVQEKPSMVCQVIANMRQMALSDDPKGAPAAAKVYLAAVGVKLNATNDLLAEIAELMRAATDSELDVLIAIKRRLAP